MPLLLKRSFRFYWSILCIRLMCRFTVLTITTALTWILTFIIFLNPAKRFLISSDEAEDLVQDLMMKFWQMKDDLANLNIKSYALKCVKNECLNKLKHETVKQNFADFQQKYSPHRQNMQNNLLAFADVSPHTSYILPVMTLPRPCDLRQDESKEGL